MSISDYEARRMARDAFEAGLTVGCGIGHASEQGKEVDDEDASEEKVQAAVNLVAEAFDLELQRPTSSARVSSLISHLAKVPGVFVYDARNLDQVKIRIFDHLGRQEASAEKSPGGLGWVWSP